MSDDSKLLRAITEPLAKSIAKQLGPEFAEAVAAQVIEKLRPEISAIVAAEIGKLNSTDSVVVSSPEPEPEPEPTILKEASRKAKTNKHSHLSPAGLEMLKKREEYKEAFKNRSRLPLRRSTAKDPGGIQASIDLKINQVGETSPHSRGYQGLGHMAFIRG